MCGIFFFFSKQPEAVLAVEEKQNEIIDTIHFRGPDFANIVKDTNYIAIHTLLSITGEQRTQPLVDDEKVIIFNGEIYNDYQNYSAEYGDSDLLKQKLSDEGITAFSNLDGEYAICTYFLRENKLYLVSDPFATKPMYYQIGKDFCCVGSYESTVQQAGQPGVIKQMTANTMLIIDLQTFETQQIHEVRPFDFEHQTVMDFSQWNQAFSKAIEKRIFNNRHNVFVSLSSGHDSGLIAAEILAQGKSFFSYIMDYKEDEQVIAERLAILDANQIGYSVLKPNKVDVDEMKTYFHTHMEPFMLINTESDFQNFKDPDMRNITGYIAAGLINKQAREDKRLISLSGQGADEIYTDYYSEHSNPIMSELKGNWHNVKKPWKNFYAGWNRVFLGGTERVAGLFGVETRYPFLDYDVVQAFLNLHPDLKGKIYKAPVTNRLQELNFPHHMRKFGFAGYDAALHS